MKKLLLVSCLLLSIASYAQEPLKVMTFNIRLNIASDSLNAWPYRKDHLASQVLYYQVHLLGVQEALPLQMNDLRKSLKQYKTIGGGREDGKDNGEYSAIFYDTTRLKALQTGMFWLSETPEVPGRKGWDAAYPRMVTWAKLRDLKTRKEFFAFNTHFDHVGKIARRESALMVLRKVKELAGTSPVVFTGDFNSFPTDEPIQLILDVNSSDRLTDAKSISLTPHYGPTGTFNAFKSKEQSDQPIDYIFLKGKWKVWSHATISETWGGKFASDHFAVLAVMSL